MIKITHSGINTSVKREKEIQKSRIATVTVRDPSTKVNRVHPDYQFHVNRLALFISIWYGHFTELKKWIKNWLEKPLGDYFQVHSPYYHAVQRKHLFLYLYSDRPGLKKPKKDNHQYWSQRPPEFISLSQFHLI